MVLKNFSQECAIKINVDQVLSRLYINWAFPRSYSNLVFHYPDNCATDILLLSPFPLTF